MDLYVKRIDCVFRHSFHASYYWKTFFGSILSGPALGSFRRSKVMSSTIVLGTLLEQLNDQ